MQVLFKWFNYCFKTIKGKLGDFVIFFFLNLVQTLYFKLGQVALQATMGDQALRLGRTRGPSTDARTYQGVNHTNSIGQNRQNRHCCQDKLGDRVPRLDWLDFLKLRKLLLVKLLWGKLAVRKVAVGEYSLWEVVLGKVPNIIIIINYEFIIYK